jgi:hypothetical protein
MLSSTFVVLHVLTMFVVVALHSGPQILVFVAARTGQLSAVAGVAGMYARSGRAVPPLGIAGALFGFGAALAGGFGLLAPWLLIAYVLFGALIVFGGAVSAPYIARLSEAVLQDTPDRDVLLGRRLTVILAIDALIYVLIITDMVLKPFRY